MPGQFPLGDTRPETIRQVLWAARTLLVDHWIQGDWALCPSDDDAFDDEAPYRHVNPLDPRACKFCPLGAIIHVLQDGHLIDRYEHAGPLGHRVIDALAEATGQRRPYQGYPAVDLIINWADARDRIRAEILAAFDRAIAAFPEPALNL